jgi:hypothetical protein
MAYKGKFSTFDNPQKYIGDTTNVTYRSLWERNVMRWLDSNPDVVEWGSEELYIPYEHPIRGGKAKYYPDFIVKWSNGQIKLIEVKPFAQTRRPNKPNRQTQKYLSEVMTFAVNQEKWAAAQEFSARNKMDFEIWTEIKLKKFGILNWETDKAVLMQESKNSNKPKLKHINKKKPNRPKRRS